VCRPVFTGDGSFRAHDAGDRPVIDPVSPED
jgi:hypothetical protein